MPQEGGSVAGGERGGVGGQAVLRNVRAANGRSTGDDRRSRHLSEFEAAPLPSAAEPGRRCPRRGANVNVGGKVPIA